MKINNIMKTMGIILLFQFSLSANAIAQTLKTPAPSPLQTIEQAFGLSNVKIEYSRPSVKGRVIFGDLVPYGKIWRTGANSSTKITFPDDVKIEGMPLVAGTYAIYTMPGADSWDVMFYKDLKLGGDVTEYKMENEVLKVKVKPSALSNKVETFTINFADITTSTMNIELLWDKTRVALGVKTEIDEKVLKSIEAALEKDTRPYFQAASYYFDNGKDLATALKWVNTAIESNPKAFWMYHLKAKIQKKMNDNKGAIETAQKSLELAKEEKNDDYVKLNEKLIGEAKKGN
jgi:tetratricopeptide (TPR) repeat protein